MDKEIITKVQSFGFHVWMRKESDTYMIFTDGTRLGYLQVERSSGFTMSTVHIPNSTSGAGFQMQRHVGDFDREMLESCFVHAPHWAPGSDVRSVVKWRDIEHYRASNAFNGEYQLVSPTA